MNMTRRVESVRSHCGLNSKDPRYPWLGTSGCKAIYEMVCIDDEHLLKLLNDTVRMIPGVTSTETFVYLKLAKQTYTWGTR